MGSVRIKRAYEPPAAKDGIRILVDRLWPRGIKKDGAHIDEWLKDIAPSTELRQWFKHDPKRWGEFKRRYAAELAGSQGEKGFEYLRKLSKKNPITLVYSAADEIHNNAVALREYLSKKPGKASKAKSK